ncbi:hypothetical protein EDC04DRAFT_2901339 [Pisolithus marmoratus]|nr:hypothetical protein EDC04DRAFT_2901339 [Pisolithus marmoratus]
MSSPKQQTEHGDEGGVDSIIISDLINFLSGLALNLSTADATIQEIQVWACPSLFGMLPPLPVTFPVSPHPSLDSISPRVQRIYPLIMTPAPLPSTPPAAIHANNKQTVTSLPAARVASTTVCNGPTVVHSNPTSSAPPLPQSASSAFTTAFGATRVTAAQVASTPVCTGPAVVCCNPMPSAPSMSQSACADRITSSSFTQFEVVPELLKSLPEVGYPGL